VNGELDDLRIFDRALTSAQVQSIYNQQGVPGRGVNSKVVPTFTVRDQSQNPLTLSTYGSATSNANSPFGGTEGSIENLNYGIPSSVSKTNFSFWSSNCFIEFWMYLSGTNSGNPRIIERGNYPNSEYSVYMNASSGGYYLKFSYGTNFPFAFQFVPGTWNHFSFSYNYATQTLYGSINGSVIGGGTTAGITYNSGSSVNLYPSGGGYVVDISNLRVVTGATTLPYISNFTVPTAPLSIYPTGTTALLLRSVSPLTMFSGGAIQSATGGNTVQDIGGYRIHTFTTVGTSTFTPASAGNVEVLVVAGGGSGGMRHSGGGGAGGLIYNSSFPVSGAVTVTVGDGGASVPTGGAAGPGFSGANSVFGSLTAIGGGYGNGGAGGPGGSGGGVWNNNPVGTGTAGQGNNGAFGSLGPFSNENTYAGGGGGGAGAVGTASTSVAPVQAGAGGIGLQYSISGTPVYYAGGGGGGTTTAVGGGAGGAGGLGGGGAGGGSNSTVGIAGTNGTGGGGGCGGFTGGTNYASGKGGSGIVIVRYPLPVRLTGTPLFTQLSTSATSSAVGAFSLRAVNGTSARAVNVAPGGIFPPSGMTQTAANSSTQTLGTGGKFQGSYIASSSRSDYGWGASGAFARSVIGFPNNLWQVGNYPVGGGTVSTPTTTTTGATNYNGEWLQFQTPFPINLTGYSVATSFLTSVVLLASTTGATSSWILVDSNSSITPGSVITNTGLNFAGYSYFRFVLITSTINYPALFNVQFFGTVPSLAQDFYADRLGNLLTAPVTGQSLASWLGGATGYVTTWYDQSGRGNHATQATAANQPKIDLVNKQIDFKPSAYFDLPNGTVPFGNSNYTMIVKHNTINATWAGFIGSGTYGTQNATNSLERNSIYINYWWSNDMSGGTYAQGSIISATYDNTIGRTLYVNGASVATNANKNRNSTNIQNTIGTDLRGNQGQSGGNRYLNGELYYVFLFGSALSDTDRTLVESLPI
jgi:hypothetical protein